MCIYIYIYNAKVSDLFCFDSDILYFSYLCRITLLEYEVYSVKLCSCSQTLYICICYVFLMLLSFLYELERYSNRGCHSPSCAALRYIADKSLRSKLCNV